MTGNAIFFPIIVPIATALLVLILPKRIRWAKEIASVAGATLNLLVAIFLFRANINLSVPWSGFGIDFSLRLYQFSAFIILATASFAF